MITKLIFVYNANSGKLNSLLDSAHKIISPSTYECHLCDLTFGVFSENKLWSRFRESVTNTYPNLQLEFLHKDEFEEQFKSKWLPKYSFPIILSIESDQEQSVLDTNGNLEVFMSDTEMKSIEAVEELVEAIEKRLQN